jgi:hypothetical protein
MINKKFYILTLSFFIISCSTIESTIDSTIDSISEAGDYIYDSVNFWEDETEEPQQSEAIIIEEAVEVPNYALPDDNFVNQEMSVPNPPMQQMSQPQPYFDPIYRSARQYYFVGPNGTPLLAPPPPPFPQYSIDQASPVVPYSYYNNLNPTRQPQALDQIQRSEPSSTKILPKMLTRDEEMELFAIQNDCVRVKEDLVNGGYVCDDFE